MIKKILPVIFIVFLCQSIATCAEYNFDNTISFALKSKKTKEIQQTKTDKALDNAVKKTNESIDSITEIIQKKTDVLKDKSKDLLDKTSEKTNAVLDKVDETMTIDEEIEQAKKNMDEEAESLQELYKQAEQIKAPVNQIFEEDTQEMEVLGKTFWGRKPIHPIGKYGYKGHLPNIASEFEYKKTKDEYKCLIPTNPNATKKDLIPAPRDNKAYVDIVVKKGSSSQYVNDVNDVIFILQKLIVNIEEDVNVQRFNAQVSGLLDNIFYIQDKYKNKPEANYVSFYKMLELANVARDTAILRTEAQAYSKYLAYSGEGAMYRPERIQKQMDHLLEEINKTLIVLKAVN